MPLPQPPAAVIFDMDGLLFDSEALYREALFSAGAETGLPGKYGVGVFGRVRHQKGSDLFIEAMIRLLPNYPAWTAVVTGLMALQFYTLPEIWPRSALVVVIIDLLCLAAYLLGRARRERAGNASAPK